MKLKFIFFALPLLILLSSFDGPHRKMREYIREQVWPVVKSQRQKLESQLAPADKQRLAEIRTELKALRTALKEKRKDLLAGKKGKDLSPEQRIELRNQMLAAARHSGIEKLMLEASGIAARYYDAIQSLLIEMEADRMRWSRDIQALLPENHAHKSQMKGLGRMFSAVGFLLIDPQAELPDFKPTRESSVFPNPVSGQFSITFSVEEAGEVTIEIFDARGNSVRKIVQATSAGEHTLEIPAQDLAPGVYIVKITNGQSVETHRITLR